MLFLLHLRVMNLDETLGTVFWYHIKVWLCSLFFRDRKFAVSIDILDLSSESMNGNLTAVILMKIQVVVRTIII